MINKRLLVKNLLAHNDENSFYDKKLQLNLGNKEGKAKFLKHICALSNSNPKNNSYIVVGIMDHDNDIVGVDFFDDAKLQNLVNAYLNNPPLVLYENIHFPHLPDGKVVGLVTIKPTEALTTLRKNIWKYYGGSVFFREGSTSSPRAFDVIIKDINSNKEVFTTSRIAMSYIGPRKTLFKTINVLSRPNRDNIITSLISSVNNLPEEINENLKCINLISIAQPSRMENSIKIDLGLNQGISQGNLALSESDITPFAVFEVIKAEQNSSILVPLNTSRDIKSYYGKAITFMEF